MIVGTKVPTIIKGTTVPTMIAGTKFLLAAVLTTHVNGLFTTFPQFVMHCS